MKKIYIIILLFVLVPGIIIMLYSSLKSKDAFSENLIRSLSRDLEKDLIEYFNPIRKEFEQIINTYQSFSEDQFEEDSLASFFIPVIARIPAIGKVNLYNTRGNIFSIYREKNTYVSSLEKQEEDLGGLIWSRRKSDKSVSSTWTEVLHGQEAQRKVVLNIIEMITTDDESVIWTGIYQSKLLGEPVISAAVDWESANDSSIFVCSFEMPIRLIIRHLQPFNKYRNRRIFLAMESGQLVDIPAQLPDNILSFEEQYKEGLKNTIQDSILLKFLESWTQLGADVNMTYHQRLDHDDWWIHIRQFQSFEKIAAVGLAVPEAYLKLGVILRNYRIILVILFLLISTLLYLAASKRRRKAAMNFSDAGTQNDWNAIINKGENQYAEFKSALRMDMNLGKVNPRLEEVIIKSVAAFSNGEGGILLIGVGDDAEVLGLEGDYNSLKKQDSDYFEIHLRNLLKQQFGITFITRNIKIEFPVLNVREFCAITINKGTEPVYVNTVDKNGNKTERFYVRSVPQRNHRVHL